MIAAAELLQALKLVEDISTALYTTSWIWGGLAVDIYQGHLLREHHDLDYLTLGLQDLKEPMIDSFQEYGWKCARLINGDIQIKKDEAELQFGNVTCSTEARWTHNGDLGSIYFPPEWLQQSAIGFYDVGVHVVTPEFQYALLAHPELLNRKWALREKDIAAKAYLKALLENKGINQSNLETLIHA
jgi:hypothetical protein